MKRTFAMAVAVAASALTAGVGSQPAVAPRVTVSAQEAPPAPNHGGAGFGPRRVLENIPQTSLWLGLRMQNGRMYAMNGSGGADADITPHIVIGPLTATPPAVSVQPPLLIPPKTTPHR
ncbi:MAG: hypothetical protein M3Y28_05795 [Armatimonadota bacterium]|nr:hypothetical protein [Armatimonadota bacterium]